MGIASEGHAKPMKRKIAIIGMSFRFPGTDAGKYWTDLIDGQDLISVVEPGRWAQETFRHPNKNHPGTSYTFAAGSIGDVSGFDAAFFGISPREAAQMDPQQRLLLEMSWEAFENSGIKPSSVKGTSCGVFIGISSADYAYRFAEDLGAVDSTVATGNTASIAANRISYVFDLRGPSMALDTACSSSLVAFHQACQSILSNESSLAVTGGVSLHLHPYGFIAFSKASMLSKRGKCNVFDAAGDGYVRSEGGGIFVLKDYDKAVADGNRILAVVAATAVNSDGKKAGLTVPSSQAQTALLKQTYARAGIAPAEIDYIEAHGTGTAVGDPIETHALGEALGKFRAKDKPLLIGSVKSNMGHLEAASGVAGLVKALHCVQRRAVPATIHITTPNPNIKFDEWNLHVVQKTTPLKQMGRVVVGVNSFGFGGANAHVILESSGAQNVAQLPKHARLQEGALIPLVISAKSNIGLKACAKSFAAFLRSPKNTSLYNTAYAAAFNREWHEHRAVVYGGASLSVANALDRFAEGGESELQVDSGTALASPSAVAFIYSGNGSQWEGMGRRLLAEDSVFRQAVRAVDQIFKQYADYSLEDELNGENMLSKQGRYARTEIAQPALFAIQVGVTQMLRSHGLMPSAVAGHSVGEVAAAWAAGALTLEQAVQVIYHRSALQGKTKGMGQMSAVALGFEAAQALLAETGFQEFIALAGVNSSRGVTIAGDIVPLSLFEAELAKRIIGYKRLDLDYAFHSPAMDGIEVGIHQSLGAMRPGETQVMFVSTVTGKPVPGDALTADYWWQNIRKPVLFAHAIKRIQQDGIRVFVEIGPHAILRSYINDSLKEAKLQGRVITTLQRGDDRARRVWGALSQTLIAGVTVDWKMLFPHTAPFAELPTYSWQRETLTHAVTPDSLKLLQRRKVHPLLGFRLSQQEFAWENQIDASDNPMLADHVVGDGTVFPGTAFAELALAASAQLQLGSQGDIPNAGPIEIEELEIRSPLMLSQEHSKTLRVVIDSADGSFTIRGKPQQSEDGWTLHATGRIPGEPENLLSITTNADPLALPARAADFNAARHLSLTESVGLNYGPAFQAVESGWVDGNNVWAKLQVPRSIEADVGKYLIHPALLDCTFQLIIHLMQNRAAVHTGIAYVPTKFGRIFFNGTKAVPAFVRATLLRHSPHSLSANFTLFDEQGALIGWVKDARFRSIRLRKDAADHLRLLNYHAIPKPSPLSPAWVMEGAHRTFEQAMNVAVKKIAARGAIASYVEEVEPLLDALCASFAAEAVAHLHESGVSLRNDIVMRYDAKNAESAPLLARLLHILGEDQLIVDESGEYRLQVADGTPTSQDIWNSLIADHPDRLPILNAVGRIGRNLASLIQGEKSLPALLPRECTLPQLFQHVIGSEGRQGIGQAVRESLTGMLEKLPEGQRLRVIEIGDGMPLFAGDLCHVLDFDRCDYVFATTNTAIAEECRRLQEKFTRLNIQSLAASTNTNAAAAGSKLNAFEPTFQLAIVACDFSSEENERIAVEHVRKVLAAGASLLMLGVPSSRWADFVFGGARSWWPSSADEAASIQRSSSYWRARLDSMGFANSRLIPIDPVAPNSPYLLLAETKARAESMLAARPDGAKAAVSVNVNIANKRVWLALVDNLSPSPTPSFSASSRLSYSQELAGAIRRNVLVHGDDFILASNSGPSAPRGNSPVNITDVKSDVEYAIDFSDVTAVESMMSEIKSRHPEIAGVLHLYGLVAAADEPATASLLATQVERCAIAANVLQALETCHIETAFWLVTAGAASSLLPYRRASMAATRDATLWGLGRTLMNEPSHVSVHLLDIEGGTAPEIAASAIAREISQSAEDFGNNAENELVFTTLGARYVPRLRIEPRTLRAAPPSRANAAAFAPVASAQPTIRLGFQFPGQLRNLRWEPSAYVAPQGDQVEIEVRATGLNFRDVMYALGLLSDEAVEDGFAGPTLGLECSGVVTAIGSGVTGFEIGDSVVAFGPSSLSNRVLTSEGAVSRIPSGISFEAAATIPGTFFTAHYALNHLAKLCEGERILIHGAAGGVGIAAIQLAKWCGAEIFATAGSDEKRDFVRLLGADHVFDSRSHAFADQILSITNGEGVDVVLNSLAGEAINRNLRVLKPFGRFLELGKRDFYENTKIGLRPFRNNISYFGIDADQLMKVHPTLTHKLFRDVMTLFSEGVLHPLPYQSFEADDVVDAFRYMQQARQIGKIVITYRNGINHIHSPKPAHRALQLPPSATYLVTGGLGGFGLKTAQWLVSKGARNLVLISRSGPVSTEAMTSIAELKANGVRVHAAACDVTNEKALTALFALISTEMPPLRGIVHAAVVIEDGLVRNTNAEQIRNVLAPKILGAQYLHRMTRHMKMDFFVLFSSATTLFGNPGQANYVAANAYLESLAEARLAAGLPAMCVRWGAIDDAGFLARNEQIKQAMQSRMGGSALQSQVALNMLEELMVSNRSGLGVLELDWRALNRFLPSSQSPKFSELVAQAGDTEDADDNADDIQRMVAELSQDELLVTFKQMLKEEIGEILRISPEKIEDTRSLYDMGLDSLMGVELGLAIESRFGVKLPVLALSESPTIVKLAEKLISILKAAGTTEESASVISKNDLAAQVQQAASQHALDVDESVIEEVTKTIQSNELQKTGRMIH
jgi:phthiocerol/phenolphthiocerol synthesis type-I polyketide synthase C